MSKCTGPTCGRRIVWVFLTNSGKRHPIDPEPVGDGNIAITTPGSPGKPPTAVSLGKTARMSWPGPLYLSHFSTCPDAERFRKQ